MMSDMTGSRRMTIIWTQLIGQSDQLRRQKFDRSAVCSITIETIKPFLCCESGAIDGLNAKKKEKLFEWGETQAKAFNTLREALLKRPILKLPYHLREFTLSTDASNNKIGTVLMHKQKEKLHSVAYASKK